MSISNVAFGTLIALVGIFVAGSDAQAAEEASPAEREIIRAAVASMQMPICLDLSVKGNPKTSSQEARAIEAAVNAGQARFKLLASAFRSSQVNRGQSEVTLPPSDFSRREWSATPVKYCGFIPQLIIYRPTYTKRDALVAVSRSDPCFSEVLNIALQRRGRSWRTSAMHQSAFRSGPPGCTGIVREAELQSRQGDYIVLRGQNEHHN